MNTASDTPPPNPTDADWVATNVPRFENIRPRFRQLGDSLKAVLELACRHRAPQAIVLVRTKAVESFAEKIIRKKEKYQPDPLERLTDLCGARIIAQTAAHVRAICRFIEDNFTIDKENSEDVSNRLRVTEFGYRSVHYIVLLDEACLSPTVKDLLTSIDSSTGCAPFQPVCVEGEAEPIPLRAEIQVRTLLEHAWADIGHDLLYKSAQATSADLKRRYSSIAAVLESTDREFTSFVEGLAVYKSNYGAFLSRKDLDAEIQRLRVVYRLRESVELAVRIAELELSIGRHDQAVHVLEAHLEAQDPLSDTSQGLKHRGVHRVRGMALIEAHWDHPASPEFLGGIDSLEKSCAHPEKNAETLCALAEAYHRTGNRTKTAGDSFIAAVAADSTEPVALSHYLEFMVHRDHMEALRLAEPMMRASVGRCQTQIEAGVNLPQAWASLSRLHLFLNEPYDALHALAKLACLCDGHADRVGACCSEDSGQGAKGSLCSASRALRRFRDGLGSMEGSLAKREGFKWLQWAAQLFLAALTDDSDARKFISEHATWAADPAKSPHFTNGDRILIISGGCSEPVDPAIDELRPYLLSACENLPAHPDGKPYALISGGTRQGISGLAGELIEQSEGRIEGYGYLPEPILRFVDPPGQNPFRNLFPTPGKDFTPLDPLQAWVDLMAAGADPRSVNVLCFAPGLIAKVETAVALALGARVGFVQPAGFLPDDRHLPDSRWVSSPNHLCLPMDAMTLRAFVLIKGRPEISDESRTKYESAAKAAHEAYVKSATELPDSMQPWDKLDAGLQRSNYYQILYAKTILAEAGLGVRPCTDAAAPLLNMRKVLGKKGVERLASMEHGRWNVERLILGWTYADKKDVRNKKSPFLVPWEKIPPNIQKYDIDPIEELPKRFRDLGEEVYLLSETSVA